MSIKGWIVLDNSIGFGSAFGTFGSTPLQPLDNWGQDSSQHADLPAVRKTEPVVPVYWRRLEQLS